MIRLSSIIETFEAAFLAKYGDSLLPSQRQALAAMKGCRTSASPLMQAQCTQCEHTLLVPHSCGHRACPHCQHHESQQWLENQLKKQVPATYFLLTFTLPKELRPLAWAHQRALYSLMIQCVWETVRTFSKNDHQLQGIPGAIAVLHTHSRRLDYHPHVHLVMPAAAIDASRRLWRTKKANGQKDYLFNTTRRWPRSFAPSCSRPSASRDSLCRSAIPRPGSWTSSPSAPARRRWSISGAIFIAA